MRISGFANNFVVLIEPKLNLSDLSLAGGKNLCTVVNSKGVYRLMNPTDLPVFLSPNQRLAKVSWVDSKSVFDLKELVRQRFSIYTILLKEPIMSKSLRI